MFNLPVNITKRERMVRGALGGVLLIGAILGLGHVFALLIGILLIVEASISYCGVIDLIDRFNLDKNATPPIDKTNKPL